MHTCDWHEYGYLRRLSRANLRHERARAECGVTPVESAGTECKTNARMVAKVVAEGGAGGNARKGKAEGNVANACDYAI